MRRRKKNVNPTPQEIVIRSAEVRANWSEGERLRRAGFDRKHPVEVVPFRLVCLADLGLTAEMLETA